MRNRTRAKFLTLVSFFILTLNLTIYIFLFIARAKLESLVFLFNFPYQTIIFRVSFKKKHYSFITKSLSSTIFHREHHFNASFIVISSLARIQILIVYSTSSTRWQYGKVMVSGSNRVRAISLLHIQLNFQ